MVSQVSEHVSSIYDDRSKVYSDLHTGEIRLVTLLRGSWPDKICCELKHAALANQPTYKSLSYAWGSAKGTRPLICVDGYKHAITVNLECALRRIRQAESDLILWIDAICINQSNNIERTEQVKLMHDIFASTEEVIVYLGEPSSRGLVEQPISTPTIVFLCNDNDEDKLEIFRSRTTARNPSEKMKSKEKIDYGFDLFCFLRFLAKQPDGAPLPAFDAKSGEFIDTEYQRNLFEELRQLLLRRWWNRIWVIQEVVVPTNVTMVYGSTVAPWSMFVEAARWQAHHSSSPTLVTLPREYSTVLAYFSRIIIDIERMRDLWKVGRQTALLPLLRHFSARKATDDRDKVYALLSLAQDQTSLVPDYSLSVRAVYQSTLLDIITTTKSLNVLAGDLGRKNRQDLPSWVPDWSASYDDLDRRRAQNTQYYNVSNGCQVYVQNKEARKRSGLSSYLGLIKRQVEGDAMHDPQAIFTDILRTSAWVGWLPDYRSGAVQKPSMEACLAAVDMFLTATGRAVCLKDDGDGIIEIACHPVGEVSVIGESALSDDVLLLVVKSWLAICTYHFLDANNNNKYHESGLGDAFRRTICADRVNTGVDVEGFKPQRLRDIEHSHVIDWLLQDGTYGLTSILFSNMPLRQHITWDLRDLSSYNTTTKSVDLNIDAAIRSATLRRTFFITKNGYIGLGPAKMKAGDHICVLPGGQTPFVLRKFNEKTPPWQRKFSIVGDCYVHGLMDGEAMHEWKRSASKTKDDETLRELLARWDAANQQWKGSSKDLSDWKEATDWTVLRSALHLGIGLSVLWGQDRTENWPQLWEDDNIEWPDEFKGPPENAEEEAHRASTYALDLQTWKTEFNQMTSAEWVAELIRAARKKVAKLELEVARADYAKDEIDKLVVDRQKFLESSCYVQLV